ARNTSRSHAGSAPRATRTTAPPISIVITLGLSAPGIPPSPRNSVTTGTNSGAASAGKLSRPPRAALRQANRCWGEMSCRRATCATMAPGAKDSATIRPLASSFHRRRRPRPTWISTRPRRSELSTIWSTIYVNPSRKMGRMLQLRPGPARGGKKAAYGLSPHGLNASSEGEIRVFYDSILAYQERFLRGNLQIIFNIMGIHLWGRADPDIDFVFESLYETNDLEQANIRKIDAETSQLLVDSGVILPAEERQRIAESPDSLFANLEA